MLPLGIRQNNPGNIEHGAKWRGLAKEQPHPRFAAFVAPEWGIRAMARILRTYNRKRGISTIRGIINRWAPNFENPTDAYANNVARWAEMEPDQLVDFTDKEQLVAIIKGMIRQENGQQPYSDKLIRAGVDLAF